MKKLRNLLIVTLVLGILMSVSVFGQAIGDFTEVFDTIRDIAIAYGASPYGADFIIYLMLFMSIWRLALESGPWKEQAKGNAVKAIYVVLGLGSALTVTLLEIKNSWSLVTLAPILAVVLGIWLLWQMHHMFKQSKLTLGLILMIAGFIVLRYIVPYLRTLRTGLFAGIVTLLAIIAMGFGIVITFQGLMELLGWSPGHKKDGHDTESHDKGVDKHPKEGAEGLTEEQLAKAKAAGQNEAIFGDLIRTMQQFTQKASQSSSSFDKIKGVATPSQRQEVISNAREVYQLARKVSEEFGSIDAVLHKEEEKKQFNQFYESYLKTYHKFLTSYMEVLSKF